MIDKALDFIVDEVNAYFDLKVGDRPVKLVQLRDDDTGSSPLGNGEVGCALVNIEEERHLRNVSPFQTTSTGQVVRRNPDLMLNLYIVFAVDPEPSSYLDAMRLLSYVLACFNGRNEFNSNNSPGLDASLGSIFLDLYSLPIEQLNYLWSGLGAKYLPSVMYRVRLVAITDDRAQGAGEAISGVNIDSGTMS